MNQAIRLLLLLALAVGVNNIFAAEAAEFNQLQDEVRAKLNRLDQLIAEAKANGLATEYAEVSAAVIRYYLRAAQYDYDNADEVRELFNSFAYRTETDPQAADKLAFEELRDCIDEADYAIAQLKQQLAGEIVLTPPPDFLAGKLKLEMGYFHLDGRIVFPYSMVWLPHDDMELVRALGTRGGGYYQLPFLKENGEINAGQLKARQQDTHAQVAKNLSPYVFLTGHDAAGWMKKNHTEVLKGARHFTRYDIDSPLIRGWVSDLYRQIIPPTSESLGEHPMVHLLANEPHFSIRRGGWKSQNGLSEFTLDKYRDWVERKYKTVKQLNAVYGTTYTAFDELDTTNPISLDLRGGPVWYDWCRFNMDRVNEWFTFLKNEAQRYDGKGHPVSIKLLGHLLVDPMYDHGIDIEYLTKLQDIQGADLRVAPRTARFYGPHEQGLDPKRGWLSRYDYDWLSQAMYLDFTRSIRPGSPFYDSEWHGYSAVSWRDYNLSRDYCRAAVWQAFTHGLSGMSPWVWGRRSDGSFRKTADYIGELSTQPIAVSTFGRTMKELNAHAEIIAAMVPKHRQFILLYCQEAAIQSEAYTHHLCDVYEALKLQNYDVGFTTPSEIMNLDPAEQIVFVTPTEFIADESLAAISRFIESGGQLVSVTDRLNFAKNELGQLREESPNLDTFRTLPIDDVLSMSQRFGTLFAPYKTKAAITITANRKGKPGRAWGLFAQQAELPETGDVYVALNNAHKETADIALTPRDGGPASFVNVLTGQPVQSPVTLDPSHVLLLRLER
ncbi:MAG: beta-galactosidase [Planctomycetota bacterium]